MLFTNKLLAFFALPTALIISSAVANSSIEKSSKLKLIELKTKQPVRNLRFLAPEEGYTISQSRSGDLELITNYSVKTIIKSETRSHFTVNGSPARKKLLIEKIPGFHKNLNSLNDHEIYLADYVSAEKAVRMASGVNAQLHLDDSFISFYQPRSKTLTFKKIDGKSTPIAIKLKNEKNLHFRPRALMVTPQDVIYTDINSLGFEGVLSYSKVENKLTPIFKSSSPGRRLEACILNDELIVGEFGANGSTPASQIFRIPLFDNKDYLHMQLLYSSKLEDIGNVTCLNDIIHFIKTVAVDEKLNRKQTRIYGLKLVGEADEKKGTLRADLIELSDVPADNFFVMDGKIFSSSADKVRILAKEAPKIDDSLEPSGSIKK